jgi:DNA polymerase III epsilon subunit-like protein
MSVIFMDTETTSLLGIEAASLDAQPQIVELYCHKTNYNLETIADYHAYMRPNVAIAPEASKVHGITDDMLRGYNPFALHYKRLAYFFTGATHLIGHNLLFDKNVLKYELARIDKVTNFPWPIHDVCTIEVCVVNKGHRMSLSDLHLDLLGESFSETHTAKADTLALRNVFRSMVEKKMIESPRRRET